MTQTNIAKTKELQHSKNAYKSPHGTHVLLCFAGEPSGSMTEVYGLT